MAYAFALARSPDRGGLDAFHALTGGVLDELQLHGGYAERLGIDLGRVERLDSTVAYTDFLLPTAATARVGHTVLSKAYPVLAIRLTSAELGLNKCDRREHKHVMLDTLELLHTMPNDQALPAAADLMQTSAA